MNEMTKDEIDRLAKQLQRFSNFSLLCFVSLIALAVASSIFFGRFGLSQQTSRVSMSVFPKLKHDWEVVRVSYSLEAADNYAVTMFNISTLSILTSVFYLLGIFVILWWHLGHHLFSRSFWREVADPPGTTRRKSISVMLAINVVALAYMFFVNTVFTASIYGFSNPSRTIFTAYAITIVVPAAMVIFNMGFGASTFKCILFSLNDQKEA